jgi:hypothetical protein
MMPLALVPDKYAQELLDAVSQTVKPQNKGLLYAIFIDEREGGIRFVRPEY